MKRIQITSLASILLVGCASATAQSPAADPLDWLTGCWESADGTYREVWSAPEGGYLFGYAVNLADDGAVTFFEQTRIALGPPALFNAYPAGEGPSPFTEQARTEGSIAFANAAHDYPQAVTYERTETGLAARISLIDGSDAREFVSRPCAAPAP